MGSAPLPFNTKGASMSKQDIPLPRSVLDIERKYNFGKTYAEILGIVEDQQKSIEEITGITTTIKEDVDKISLEVLSPDGVLAQLKVSLGEIEARVDEQCVTITEDGLFVVNGSYTQIDGGTIMAESLIEAPKILGGTIYGGYFCDENANAYIRIGCQDNNLADFSFIRSDGFEQMFQIYDDISITHLKNRGSAFLSLDGISARPQGVWDFSEVEEIILPTNKITYV